jgi:hypothetical protein
MKGQLHALSHMHYLPGKVAASMDALVMETVLPHVILMPFI